MNPDQRMPRWVLVGLLVMASLPAVAADPGSRVNTAVQGRWVAGPISLNQGGVIPVGPFCRLFTRNLNQFQTLSFNTCSPRLSKRYSQLRRPHWTLIPWDRALARAVVTTTAGPYPASSYEQAWRDWLKETRVLRRAGAVRLWSTKIDLLGNGQFETLIRLDHVLYKSIVIRGGRVVYQSRPPYCGYIDSQLYLLPSSAPTLAKAFNQYAGSYGDVLYDKKSKGYVFLNWQRTPAPTKFFSVATGSVIISTFYDKPYGSGFIPGCYVNWIPARPAQPPKPSSH